MFSVSCRGGGATRTAAFLLPICANFPPPHALQPTSPSVCACPMSAGPSLPGALHVGRWPRGHQVSIPYISDGALWTARCAYSRIHVSGGVVVQPRMFYIICVVPNLTDVAWRGIDIRRAVLRKPDARVFLRVCLRAPWMHAWRTRSRTRAHWGVRNTGSGAPVVTTTLRVDRLLCSRRALLMCVLTGRDMYKLVGTPRMYAEGMYGRQSGLGCGIAECREDGPWMWFVRGGC